MNRFLIMWLPLLALASPVYAQEPAKRCAAAQIEVQSEPARHGRQKTFSALLDMSGHWHVESWNNASWAAWTLRRTDKPAACVVTQLQNHHRQVSTGVPDTTCGPDVQAILASDRFAEICRYRP